MIDLHCHVLCGIDDGPATIEGSIAIALASASTGTRTILATPHVNWRYPNTADTIAPAVARLNERLTEEEIEVEILAGGEIAMTRNGDIAPDALSRLALAGGGRVVVGPAFPPLARGLGTSPL